MIKVLIVEDSRVAQEFLAHILTADPGIQVVGVVSDGADALQAVQTMRPDVVTMDIHMPKMGGYEATRAIMENAPTPIVIVSASTGAKDADSTFRAIEAGALAVVLRPPGFGHPAHKSAVRELVWTVKTMSEIKVVRRYTREPRQYVPALAPVLPLSSESQKPQVWAKKNPGAIQLIAMGASTGGPPVLHKILSQLPPTLPVPILIVQHIAPGFVQGFVDWLGSSTKFPVQIAAGGQQLLPGHAYVAPDGFHMGIESGLRIVLSSHAAENGLRPSVAHLFRTVAQVLGADALGVLLTGMGRDGARELREMRDRGAVTIAQDETSSVVHGMPGEAIKLDGATFILSPTAIPAVLIELTMQTNRRHT